jgi:DNA repair exonuclease SbcCD ATPase subunit
MSEDPRTGGPAEPEEGAPAEPGQAGPVDALRQAIARTAQWLAAQQGMTDVAALRCVRALDDALPELAGLLGQLPKLVQRAEPGPRIGDRITAYGAELARLRTELAAGRAALDAAGDLKRQIRELQSERDLLSGRIEELERGQRIAGELPRLRALLSALEAAVDDDAVQAGREARRGLTDAARTLLKLLGDRQEVLGAELDRLLADTVAADEKVAADLAHRDQLAAELVARTATARQLQEELGRISGLELHRKADEDLADGLRAAGLSAGGPPPGGAPPTPEDRSLADVRAALDGIAQQLADVDRALRPLLTEHARAYEDATRILNWSG